MGWGIDKLVDELKTTNCPAIYNTNDESCGLVDDPRNPSIPRKKWIRKALKSLAQFEYIKKGEKDGHYILTLDKYRRVRKPLETFINKVAQSQLKKERSKKPGPKQLGLFDNKDT